MKKKKSWFYYCNITSLPSLPEGYFGGSIKNYIIFQIFNNKCCFIFFN